MQKPLLNEHSFEPLSVEKMFQILFKVVQESQDLDSHKKPKILD